MPDLVNYKRKRIDKAYRFTKPEYWTGRYDDYGMRIPDDSFLDNADEEGFDRNNKETNGDYRMRIALPKNTVLILYGSEMESFTAPKGTKYEELSLPYEIESVPYHEYVVIADSINVTCEVVKGKWAPGFGQPGGGVKYFHDYNMIQSQNKHLLEEITNNENDAQA